MAFHWLVAAGIAFLYVHGFDMMRIEGPDHLVQLNLHRSVGVTVFALVLARIWWRMTHPPPEIPMPRVQAWVANVVHLLIYALLVVNGIAGTVGWIASGDPVVFFGVELAPGRAAHPALGKLCILVGMTTARALAVMIALHVLGVLKHEVFDRDRVLERMMPGPPIVLPRTPREIAQSMGERRKRRGQSAQSQAARE
jgi:cytochrome b561